MKIDRFLLITVGALLAILIILLAMGGAAFLCMLATNERIANNGPLLEKSYDFNGTLDGYGEVDLQVTDINGYIKVVEAEGDAYDISVNTSGTARDHERYKVEFTQYESAGVKALKLEVKDTWEPSTYSSRYVSDITVAIPRGKLYDMMLATVNGRVSLGNLTCDEITMATVNGEVVSGASAANATYATVNGGIDVSTGAVKGKIFANLVNGDIAISIPQGSALSLNAHVVNGDISSALPIVVDEKSRWGLVGKTESYAEGLYVEAATINGGIVIKTH
jgi:DUF4097 and DUF4098 domain-containing protein YvlB